MYIFYYIQKLNYIIAKINECLLICFVDSEIFYYFYYIAIIFIIFLCSWYTMLLHTQSIPTLFMRK